MATIKFKVRGKANPSNVYARFSAGKTTDVTRKTPLAVNPKFFSNKTGRVKKMADFSNAYNFQNTLNGLEISILEAYNDAISNKKIISGEWLQSAINEYFNISTETDLSFLDNFFSYYIEKLKKYPNPTTKKMTAPRTILKYENTQKKIKAYEKHKGKKIKIADVCPSFQSNFIVFLSDVENLHRNTIGKHLSVIKRVCNAAGKNGIRTNEKLSEVKGWGEKKEHIIYLNATELHKIKTTPMPTETLKNAKDWLIIGCETGQRISDLCRMNKECIRSVMIGGKHIKVIEITQQKVNTPVTIPITEPVKEILKKHGGNFPPFFSKNFGSGVALFNRHIKKVCKIAGINQKVTGSKKNPQSNRLEVGQFPKYELITSHICRRSFASNYYGEIPTPVIMAITGHKRESQFLDYIGKSSTAYLSQFLDYQQKKAENEIFKIKTA